MSTGYISEKFLAILYRNAQVFLFPSKYEGFGLPVLEAMACGCPVVCSTAGSLAEVAGDAAILVDPQDREGMGEAVAQLLSDRSLLRLYKARSVQRAAKFSWERTAREVFRVYEQVVQSRN